MLAVEFEGSRQIGKPVNMTDEECSGLEILQAFTDKPGGPPEFVAIGVTDGPPYPFTLSCWKPSREDLEALNAGRPIWVRVLTHTVHPIAIFTTDAAGEINQ